MTFDASAVGALIAAVTAGGFATEVYRSWKNRKRVDLDLFYPTWKEEMARLHVEIAELRRDVLALSMALRELGGDPLAVRFSDRINHPYPYSQETE